ncbi:MAG: PH domain-containing protein [Pseudomonadota bacterium]
MFENSQIALDGLPSVEDIEWQPLHKSHALQIFISRLIIPVLMIVAQGVSLVVPGFTLLPLPAAVVAIGLVSLIILGWPFLAVRFKGVASRDKDIAYKTGVVFRKVTVIPFNRIQHVETSHGPLDRRFGTASLQLFTAGGSSGDLQIHGLESGNAETLRAFILNKIGGEVERD